MSQELLDELVAILKDPFDQAVRLIQAHECAQPAEETPKEEVEGTPSLPPTPVAEVAEPAPGPEITAETVIVDDGSVDTLRRALRDPAAGHVVVSGDAYGTPGDPFDYASVVPSQTVEIDPDTKMFASIRHNGRHGASDHSIKGGQWVGDVISIEHAMGFHLSDMTASTRNGVQFGQGSNSNALTFLRCKVRATEGWAFFSQMQWPGRDDHPRQDGVVVDDCDFIGGYGENGRREGCMRIQSAHNVEVRNSRLFSTNAPGACHKHTFRLHGDSSNVTLENCDLVNLGGSVHIMIRTGVNVTPAGMLGPIENVTVVNNRIYSEQDGGGGNYEVSIAGTAGHPTYQARNFRIRGNRSHMGSGGPRFHVGAFAGPVFTNATEVVEIDNEVRTLSYLTPPPEPEIFSG